MRTDEAVFRGETRTREESGPSSEEARYEPRFRVMTRRSLVTPPLRSTGGSLRRSLFLAALPVFCLMVYVLCWTLSMRGEYYRDRLQSQIKTLRIEQAELNADKRRLQSPGLILGRAASELGMQPAEHREFAQLSAPREPQRTARR